MTRTSIIIAAALAFAASLPAAPALAQRDRVFVASYGSDGNPCTFGSPCKTFQNAVNVVASGGEVTAIDSAGFGTITISHAVTVTSPNGVEAGIAAPASGGAAITINAGSGDVVRLNGLTLDGDNVANTTGIAFNTGEALHVQNCVIRSFGSGGISFAPTALSALSVSNTLVSDNIGGFGIKIANLLQSNPYTTSAVLTRDELDNNGDGIDVSAGLGGTYVSVVDSVVANNSDSGIKILNSSDYGGAAVMLRGSSIMNNNVGLNSSLYSHPCQIYADHSTIFGNGTGLKVYDNTACILSHGNNSLDANNTEGSFQGTIPLQ
jgi:hypothetical protein